MIETPVDRHKRVTLELKVLLRVEVLLRSKIEIEVGARRENGVAPVPPNNPNYNYRSSSIRQGEFHNDH